MSSTDRANATAKLSKTISREDSLEYFIKFPTPNFRSDPECEPSTSSDTEAIIAAPAPVAESDYIFVYNDTNVPIVLLLGWAGCQDRYLMKYSKIYEDRGLITVRYTAPVDNLFWNREAMGPIGHKILKLLFDMNFDSHPLIVHVFSNGGAYLYQHILLAMKQTDSYIDIRGLIFDSAPGERRLMGLFRATSTIYGKEKRCNCIVAWLITITIIAACTLENLIKRFISFTQSVPYEGSSPYQHLLNEDTLCPQLFLYSKDDKLIPYMDIEKYAEHRQRMGAPAELVCFEHAEHVKLYTKYPQKYVQSVCKFIKNCLANTEANWPKNKNK